MEETYKVKKLHWWYYPIKYSFDFLMALIGVILLSWLYIILAILVKCTSKGKILFRDVRVGKNGKIIHVLKFRTMFSDANENPGKYMTKEQMEEWKKERKLERDPRVTKIGHVLRKTSLDELPQLFNILAGQMSLVGPRPITPAEEKKNYTPEQIKIIRLARPGITGYWQVNGRNNATYAGGERARLNLAYFEQRSLWLDVKILFKTVPTVLTKKGAV